MVPSPNRQTCPRSWRRSNRSWPECRYEKGSMKAMTEKRESEVVDGGLVNRELAATEVQGLTRSSFILRGALAAGALYGTSAVTPFVSQALAASGSGDVEIL